jgi:hypothetical protein
MAETKPESTTETPVKAAPVETEQKSENKPIEDEDPEWKARVEKIAQSAADKVRFEYSKKLKDAQKEIDTLKIEKMSEGEKREFEAQKLKEALESKEKDLTRREMELLAIKGLDEKKLPSAFIDFVIGENEETTQKRIDVFSKAWADELKSAVDARMKVHGIVPGKGRGSDTTSFEGMTPSEIQKKGRDDPEWFRKNEKAIMEHYKGGYK